MFEIIQGIKKEFYKALSSKSFLNINEQMFKNATIMWHNWFSQVVLFLFPSQVRVSVRSDVLSTSE